MRMSVKDFKPDQPDAPHPDREVCFCSTKGRRDLLAAPLPDRAPGGRALADLVVELDRDHACDGVVLALGAVVGTGVLGVVGDVTLELEAGREADVAADHGHVLGVVEVIDVAIGIANARAGIAEGVLETEMGPVGLVEVGLLAPGRAERQPADADQRADRVVHALIDVVVLGIAVHADRAQRQVDATERAHPVDAAARDVVVTAVEARAVAAAVVAGVRDVARAELQAADTRREVGRLGDVAEVEVDAPARAQVVGVAVDAARAGLRVLAAGQHHVLGAVLAAELDPAEAAREEQIDLVDEGVLIVGLAAAELDLDIGAVGQASVRGPGRLDVDLVVHEEGVAAVPVALKGLVGRAFGAKLGVAAESDFDVGLGWGGIREENAGAHERGAAQQQPVMHDPVLHSHPQGRVFYLDVSKSPVRNPMRRTLNCVC